MPFLHRSINLQPLQSLNLCHYKFNIIKLCWKTKSDNLYTIPMLQNKITLDIFSKTMIMTIKSNFNMEVNLKRVNASKTGNISFDNVKHYLYKII